VATLSAATCPDVIVEFAVSVAVTAEVTAAIVAAANRLAGRVDRSLNHRGFDEWCFDHGSLDNRGFRDRRFDDSDGVAGIVPTVRPVAPTAVNESAIETVASVLMPAGSTDVMCSRPASATLVSTFAATLRERWRTSGQGQCDSDSSDEGGLVRHGRAPRFF
jgi:hypothetical protein